METATPLQLISASLETLHQAAALIQGDKDRLFASGINKAAGILEILVAERSGQPDEPMEAIPEKETYTPEVLPLNTLLAPIHADQPAGENTRLTGEVTKLLSLVVNRSYASDFRPQYRTLREKAEDLLTKRTKDIGVAVRLTEAAINEEEKSGFAAVADGLLLINGFLETFWEGLFPEIIDGDCEARGNELKQFEELITMRLAARYGKPHEFAPSFSDVKAAAHEAAIFDTIFEQLDLLDKTTFAKFDDQAPSLADLRSTLAIYRKRTDAQFETFRQRILERREDAARQREEKVNAAIDKLSTDIDKQESANNEEAFAGLRDMAEAERIIDSCAKYMVQNNPGDPVGYLINRNRRWFGRSSGALSVDSSPDRRQKIEELFTAKKWNELLTGCEDLFINGDHHWLDLQRYQILAAEHLGSDYDSVVNCLKSAIRLYSGINKEILDSNQPNSFVSPETVRWIREEISTGGTSDGAAVQPESIYTDELKKADEMIGRGKSAAALNLLLSRQNQAHSKRERFIWQLTIVEFCIRTNMMKIVLPTLEYMIETIDRLNLAEWEEPEILRRVFKAGYEGYLSLGIDRAPEEKLDYFYRRICVYDPAYFFSSAGE